MSVVERMREREPLVGVQRVVAWAGLSTALIGPALTLLPSPPLLTFLAVLAFACVGPGAAVVCHVRLGDPVAAWATVLVLSLAVTALGAVTLAWAQWWQPTVGLLSIGGLAAASCLIALIGRLWPERATPPPVHDVTTFIPRVTDETTLLTPVNDATSVIPRITDETAVIPRITDQTAVIPRVINGTSLLARVADEAMVTVRIADETTVIPRITDETTVIPRITDETTMIPRIADATTVIPRGDDATGLLPRLHNGTALIPAFTDRAVAARGAYPPGIAQHRDGKESAASLVAGVFGLLAVAGAWVFALTQARMDDVDDYGLLAAMHPAFYIAVAACVLAFVLELARRTPRGWLLAGHTVLLLLIMHATVPILMREPEYAWTYKHLGVIDLIATGRPLTNVYDIYQQWPAFFAVVAQLTASTGVSALRAAPWAPLFFGLINLLPMYAIARTLSTDRRVPYLTVFVFSAVNWVAQDYLAPQAFAYTLCLGTALVMLRWLRRDPTAGRERLRPLARLSGWVQAGIGQMPYTSGRSRRLALVTLYIVYTAVTVSHQLSPYLIAMSAAMLILFRLVQAFQIVPIFIGIAVLQLVPRYQLVESFGLFNGFNFFANAHTAAPTLGAVSPGRIFSVQMVQVLAFGVWGLAALVVIANRRRLGPFAVPAALAAGPFALLLGNSYGGEAIFRVFLFSSPWCAFLIATGLLRLRLDRRLATALATPALAAAVLIAIQGEHGQLMVNRFSAAEVEASQYLYANIPDGAAVVSAGSNFPDRLTARYADVFGSVGSVATLLPSGAAATGEVELGDAMNDADLDAVNGYFDGYSMPVFLVVSRSQANAAKYFGYFPDGKLDQLSALLIASPQWQLWYGNADTKIFKFVPGGAAARPPGH